MPLKSIVLLALLLLQAESIASPFNSSSKQDYKLSFSVEREIILLGGGLLLLNETIVIREPPPELLTISIGHPSLFREEYSAFYLYSEDRWRSLEFEVEGWGEDRWFIIHLPEPLEGELLRLRASYLYVEVVGWRNGNYHLQVPLYPFITRDFLHPILWNITSLSFKAYLPEGSQLVDVESPIAVSNFTKDGLYMLYLNASSLNPYERLDITLTYTPPVGESDLILIESMRGRLRVGWKVRVEETYTLINRGDQLERLYLRLPSKAGGVRGWDRAGPLRVRKGLSEKGLDVYIYPRTTVRGGERWSFILVYTMPRSELINRSRLKFILSYSPSLPYYVSKASIEIQLPEGAFPVAQWPEGEVKRASPLSYKVSFALDGFAPINSLVFSVEYRWAVFWLLLRPMLWGLLIFTVSAVLLTYTRRRRIEVREERPTLLQEFLGLYDRRVGLLLELEEMEEALEKKEIGRERFERETAEIHRRMMELSKRLKRLEARVKEEQPELRERLRELRDAEGELERVMTALRGLERRLRRRRISRRDYLERRREHIERRRRVIRRMEGVISALRGRSHGLNSPRRAEAS